jgi:nicotinate-nucleotide adenylyltransferase
MHIGILGGSFNPPHIGHLFVAQQVLDFTDIEQVWFLPAYNHTFDKPLAPVADRLAMTKLLKLAGTHVSTLEIDQKLDGNTINLLPILKKQYHQDRFTFLIGSDQLTAFTKWGNWQELLRRLPFLVIPRAGYAMEPLQPKMRPLIHKHFITTNISSSMVRERIRQGLTIDYFVTPEVQTYIHVHDLYVNGEKRQKK